jgi:hypothetical protein
MSYVAIKQLAPGIGVANKITKYRESTEEN